MPDSENIIPMPTPMTVLADRIRAAYARTAHGRQEWIDGTLELAAALLEARAGFKVDRQFSVWLAENDLDALGKDDRAALLKMAADPETLGAVLVEQQDILHANTLWRKYQGRFRSIRNRDAALPDQAETPSTPGAERDAPAENAPPETSSKPVSKRSPFYGLARGADVEATYTSINARTAIGKAVRAKTGKEILALILDAIDAGFALPTATAFDKVSARILFPVGARTYCGRFDLTNTKARHYVRDHIMPAAKANRDAVIAAPERLEEIVAAHGRGQQQAVRDAAAQQKRDAAVRAMPADQVEIEMYGVKLWPRVGDQYGAYDYDPLRAAVWHSRDVDAWVRSIINDKQESPKSRATYARISTRWPSELMDRAATPEEARESIRQFYKLVRLLADLRERHTGDCSFLPHPVTEGQWP